MKKFILAALAIFTIIGIYSHLNQSTAHDLSVLALYNIEALTQDETTKCPDANYVPDHYIEAELATVSVTCTKKGELQVGSHIVSGSYERGHEYVVIIEKKNCDGMAAGACCDQRQVGIRII